ncbi:hypothetical protein E24_00157 [Faustovirus]|nr:hypothetical protein PRJ_Fausto_00143 [Faustovirus]AMN83088.1 hypothetical protein E24_00157 [Faustovirus]AMN84070.1 hypothetical protein D5a_00156 [Faustovirus]AMN85057.1 hypothetical protein E23_00156 [Faustovirus]QBR99056.1 hypothetical protein [Faustovirus mariensis]
MTSFGDLPNEITDIIINDVFKTQQMFPALILTCKLWHKLLKVETKLYLNPMRYYLKLRSITGMEFAKSLLFEISYNDMELIVSNDLEFNKQLITRVKFSEFDYIRSCLRFGRDSHAILLLKNRKYTPSPYLICIAAEYNRCNMIKLMLDYIPNESDKYTAVIAAVKHIQSSTNILRILTLGLELKQTKLHPKYISVVIYAIYKYALEEPEFIIRWILDNLDYHVMYLPKRNRFGRVNNMLKQHGFEFIRDCDADVIHLLKPMSYL